MVELNEEEMINVAGGNALDTTTGSFVSTGGSASGGESSANGQITLMCGDFGYNTRVRYCLVLKY